MSALLKDPMFFYGIAFVIFLGLSYRYGRAGFLAWIDGEIRKVRTQLDEAQQLRAEAEETLAEYKKNQTVAMAEAEELVRNAKEEAKQLKVRAENELKAALARHEQQSVERIQMAEAAAVAEVRARAIDLAVKAARQSLASQVQGDVAAKLIDQAIADLPRTASAKAEAA